MALAKASCDLVYKAFREVFPHCKIETEDRKSDGGYERVYTIQKRVDNRDLETLVDLSNTIGNSFCITPFSSDQIRVCFF